MASRHEREAGLPGRRGWDAYLLRGLSEEAGCLFSHSWRGRHDSILFYSFTPPHTLHDIFHFVFFLSADCADERRLD